MNRAPATLRRHCEAHLDDEFQTGVGTVLQLHGGWLDAPKKSIARFAIARRLADENRHGHTDPRFAAIVGFMRRHLLP